MPSDCDLRMRNRYGVIPGRERVGYANREMKIRYWEALHGQPWPEGMLVLHTCDEGRCCNPEHLFPGTYKDNAKDAARKGRLSGSIHGPGENHRFAKLTQIQVDEIRRRRAAGEKLSVMSREYGIGGSQLSRIVSGKRWNGASRAMVS